MRAIQLIRTRDPLEARDLPVPTPGPDDVLIRVEAAGICHSDVHYWEGLSSLGPLPLTLGHEVAGVVEAVGDAVTDHRPGDRVAVHYLLTCGECAACRSGNEQFCGQARMIGKDIHGGYAEFIAVPARNAIRVPDAVPSEQAAVSMCSSATVFHALRKTRLSAGESVAVFGVGGLGMSAVQLARAFGALDVFTVDIDAERLAVAEAFGAVPIDASSDDPVAELLRRTERGVDVSLALLGAPGAMRQAIQALRPRGRAGIVGISDRPIELDTYREVLAKEAEIIGCSDHLLDELPIVLRFIASGVLDLAPVVTRSIALDAEEINRAFENLHRYGGGIRTVIRPA